MKAKHADSKLIDALGGTTAVARLFNIQPPSVHTWRIKGVPPARMMYLRVARPDLFRRKALSHD